MNAREGTHSSASDKLFPSTMVWEYWLDLYQKSTTIDARINLLHSGLRTHDKQAAVIFYLQEAKWHSGSTEYFAIANERSELGRCKTLFGEFRSEADRKGVSQRQDVFNVLPLLFTLLLQKARIAGMLKKIWNGIVYIFALTGLFFVVGFLAVKFGLTNTAGVIDNQRAGFLSGIIAPTTSSTVANPLWYQTEEWQVLEIAIRRDQPAIQKAADTAGVPARLIVANLMTEQLRLFFSEREFYKQVFAPLKILGSQTQFSWGVMGMKETTAVEVENNLKDPTSPYYLGPDYEHLLDFKATDPAAIQQERFTRMTDEHDHYYSYLYAGLYLKEVERQWSNAGFDISQRPDIVSTLYNIGFANSTPNANPSSGGAEIQIGAQTYSFGSLAGEFYASDILTDIFPR